MNVPNNKRRQNTLLKIHTAFIDLLQNQNLEEIRVTDICNLAEINRTTFYANYKDIRALAEEEMNRLEEETVLIFGDGIERSSSDEILLKLFSHIKNNQSLYKTYFKLGLDGRFLVPENIISKADRYHHSTYGKYHIEFFRNGLSALIHLWVNNGCPETPEELVSILHREYNEKD